jgi:hypothetical protein
LQAIGNSLQATGGKFELLKNGKNGNTYKDYVEFNDDQSLIVTGSWIQAIGSVISLIGLRKEVNIDIDVSEKSS